MSPSIGKITILIILSLLATFTFASTASQAATDPAAQVVYLRQSCLDNGTPLNDCFTTMNDVLNWTYSTRNPSAASPLLIDIGPGTFGGFYCGQSGVPLSMSGFITLRGSGRKNTVLGFTQVFGCQQLAFQDLSINGVKWWYEGGATYSNIEINAGTDFAWWDITYTNPSQHYWWNSVITGTPSGGGSPTATFQTYGAIHRFYGGEINAYATGDGASAVHVKPFGTNVGEIQMYGSAIRVKVNPGATVTKLTGVIVDGSSIFHLHGSTIGVDATAAGGANVGVVGINSGVNSTVHVVDVAYTLKPSGTGNSIRLQGPAGPTVTAPFWWGTGATPPAITSLDGYDLFVQTNCSSRGCQTSGTQPHMLIYSSNCTGSGGPWFDVVTAACR